MLTVFTIAVKLVLYTSTLVAAGGALARMTLRRSERSPAPLQRVAGWGLAFASATSASLYIYRLDAGLDPAVLQIVFVSPLGMALAMSLIAGLWLALGRPSRILDSLSALMALGAFGIVGHAAAANTVSAAAVFVHLAAASWWTGGLLLLLRACRERGAFVLLVDRFSGQAVWIVSALLLAGLSTAAWLLDFRFDPASAYDRGLLLKLAFVLGLLGLAAVNKAILTPALTISEKAPGRMRAVIFCELLVIALILVITATVTTVFPPQPGG